MTRNKKTRPALQKEKGLCEELNQYDSFGILGLKNVNSTIVVSSWLLQLRLHLEFPL